jgi:hypothetical protein
MAGESVRERRRRGAAGRLKRLRNKEAIKGAFKLTTSRGPMPIRATLFHTELGPRISLKSTPQLRPSPFFGQIAERDRWDLRLSGISYATRPQNVRFSQKRTCFREPAAHRTVFTPITRGNLPAPRRLTQSQILAPCRTPQAQSAQRPPADSGQPLLRASQCDSRIKPVRITPAGRTARPNTFFLPLFMPLDDLQKDIWASAC